jgi:hypothetical protein
MYSARPRGTHGGVSSGLSRPHTLQKAKEHGSSHHIPARSQSTDLEPFASAPTFMRDHSQCSDRSSVTTSRQFPTHRLGRVCSSVMSKAVRNQQLPANGRKSIATPSTAADCSSHGCRTRQAQGKNELSASVWRCLHGFIFSALVSTYLVKWSSSLCFVTAPQTSLESKCFQKPHLQISSQIPFHFFPLKKI